LSFNVARVETDCSLTRTGSAPRDIASHDVNIRDDVHSVAFSSFAIKPLTTGLN